MEKHGMSLDLGLSMTGNYCSPEGKRKRDWAHEEITSSYILKRGV